MEEEIYKKKKKTILVRLKGKKINTGICYHSSCGSYCLELEKKKSVAEMRIDEENGYIHSKIGGSINRG